MSLKGFYPELFQLRLLQELLQDSPLYLFLCSKSSLKSNNKKTNKQTNAKNNTCNHWELLFFCFVFIQGEGYLKRCPTQDTFIPPFRYFMYYWASCVTEGKKQRFNCIYWGYPALVLPSLLGVAFIPSRIPSSPWYQNVLNKTLHLLACLSKRSIHF